jgi:RimJ/RimL family protein N-acetyltransferase
MKALQKLVNQESQITRWPTKPSERTLVAEYLASKFSKDKTYSEKEVNELLKRWHTFSDWVVLRRELFERGFLDRRVDGSSYWRTEKALEVFDATVTLTPRRSTTQLFRLEGFGVRLLTLQDKDIFQHLFKRCEDFHFLSTGESLKGHEAEEALTDHPPERTLAEMCKIGLFRSETLIGFFDVARNYPQLNVSHIGLFLIDKDSRSKGVGHQVVGALEDWLKAQGVTRIMLSVLEENQAALRFWQREGFIQTRMMPAKVFGQKTHIRFEFAKEIGAGS